MHLLYTKHIHRETAMFNCFERFFFIHSVSLTRTEIPRALLDALLEKQEVNVACVTGSEWSTAH